MRHLTPAQLIDIAEGTRPRTAFPHLASCEPCERQVAELRETMEVAAAVGGDDVPEPSPLFWDYFSARVREAVAGEEIGRGSLRTMWRARWARWAKVPAGFAVAAAIAVLVLIVAVALRTGGWRSPERPTASVADRTAPAANDMVAFDDDPALTVLADLTSELDWDAASEAGLLPAAGAVDRIVFALDDDERLNLQRILEEALSRPGA